MAQNSQSSNEGPVSHQPPPTAPPLQSRPQPQVDHRKIKKVPKLFLMKEGDEDNYIPNVVSIGPYYHGKPELDFAESVKLKTAQMVVSNKEVYYHGEIKKKIKDIRNCYAKNCVDSYSDDVLVQMMLRDACFIIIHMHVRWPQGRFESNFDARDSIFGDFIMPMVSRDIILLENQIPLWIIKFLLKSRYQENQAEYLLNRYIRISFFGEVRLNIYSQPRNQEGLHLFEALYRLIISYSNDEHMRTCQSSIKCKFLCCCRNPNIDIESGASSHAKLRFRNRDKVVHSKRVLKKFFNPIRSVTELKASGIDLMPNQTLSLIDVKFESNCIQGKLHLPIWPISLNTKVFLLNVIAYELNPRNCTRGVMTTYINLMKSLVMRLEDVKELRENKILLCILGSDEQILKMFQDINTYGVDNPIIFEKVKDQIETYYIHSRRKIWIAELIHNHLSSPWKVTAWVAATCILVLTLLQTVYSMKSYFHHM